MSDGSSSFGESLIYEDRVPLGWRALAQAPTTAELLRTHESNERVLRYLSVLSEHRAEPVDEEHVQELTRLEFKTDLLLDMMGQLLAHHITIPDPVSIRLGAGGLQWVSSAPAPARGGYLRVDVYFSDKHPSPITVFGVVNSVESVDGGSRVEVEFRDMSEAVQSGIEKLIFRQHRRRVAYARHGAHRDNQ